MVQQNRRSSRKMNTGGILLRVAVVLLCLVVLSVYFMDGLYARYVTNGLGSDSARVAEFDVDVNFDDVDAEVVYNETTGTYQIVVTNQSEVAIRYHVFINNINVTLTKGSGTADGISVGIDGDISTAKPLAESLLFEDVGAIAAGSASQTHTLTFFVNWDQFLDDLTGNAVSAEITFDIRVDVEQID